VPTQSCPRTSPLYHSMMPLSLQRVKQRLHPLHAELFTSSSNNKHTSWCTPVDPPGHVFSVTYRGIWRREGSSEDPTGSRSANPARQLSLSCVGSWLPVSQVMRHIKAATCVCSYVCIYVRVCESKYVCTWDVSLKVYMHAYMYVHLDTCLNLPTPRAGTTEGRGGGGGGGKFIQS